MSTHRRLSVFDVIGPVMIGPSSSHTAGAARLGRLARELLGGQPESAVFTLYGSLASTYQGHGTDLALIGGVLGLATDDERIRDAKQLASEENLTYAFVPEHGSAGLVHPNMVRITLTKAKRKMEIVGASVGGGKVEVVELNGFPVSLRGEEHTIIVNSVDRPGVVTRLSALLSQHNVNIGNMAVSRAAKGQAVVMSIEIDSILEQHVLDQLGTIDGVERVTMLQKLR